MQDRVEVTLDEGYRRWSRSYDEEKNPLIAVEEPHVAELLEGLAYSQVLDAGAGTGRHALKLAREGTPVTAIDSCRDMLAVAEDAAAREGLAGLSFRLLSLHEPLPFDDDQFDLVICALTLTHVSDLGRTVGEFYRVLADGGHLLITDFHPDSVAQGWRTEMTVDDTTYLLPNAEHTRGDYLDAVQLAGFRQLRAMDVPLREVPSGHFPQAVFQKWGDVNLCLILLAQREA